MQTSHHPSPAPRALTDRSLRMDRPSPDAPRPRTARRHGSALVLALVTLVMLMMLGAAYLQMARTDRRTAVAVDTRTNVNDASILRYIGNVLVGDIPADATGVGNEFFDYPYSTPTAANVQDGSTPASPADAPRVVEDRFAPTTVPGPRPDVTRGDLPAREPRAGGVLYDKVGNVYATGGDDDDPWLASTEPDFTAVAGGYAYWPHVTDLLGVFLDLSDIDPGNDTTYNPPDPVNGRPLPAQYLSTANGTRTGIVTTAPQNISGSAYAVPAKPMADVAAAGELGIFADADNDGIADSRWTWAPLPSDGGQAFVMAVRIVDNSSMINLNAWDFHYNSPDVPRSIFPSDLDLETSLGVVNANNNSGGGTGNLDYAEIFQQRGLPASPGDDDRLYAWLGQHSPQTSRNGWERIGTTFEVADTANDYDNTTPPTATYRRFAPTIDEIELRNGNGLNRMQSDNTTVTPPSPLEQITGGPAFFRQANPEQKFDVTPFNTVDSYFNLEPRKRLTTLSGSASHGQVSLTDGTEQELVDAFDREEADRPALYFDNTATPTPTAPNWQNEGDYAFQMAAIVNDYRDADSDLTAIRNPDTGSIMYGMEYLPFISEVYVQTRYSASNVTGGDPTTADWSEQAADVSIEIVNPWPWSIRISDVDLIVGDQNWGPLQNLVQASFPGRTAMTGHELIVLQLPDPVGANQYNHPTTATVSNVSPIAAAVWPANVTTNDELIEIQLEAVASGNNRIVYQRFSVVNPADDKTSSYSPPPTPAPTNGGQGYVQTHTLGTGDGLAALTVKLSDLTNTILPATAGNVSPGAPNTTASGTGALKFDEHEKGVTLDLNQTPSRVRDALSVADWGGMVRPDVPAASANGAEPFQIANTSRIYRSAELGRMVFLGPREVAGVQYTIAEVWDLFPRPAVDEFEIGRLMLQPYKADGTTGDRDAVELFSAFTSFEKDTTLLPGRLNLNTAPEWLIAAALPLPDLTTGGSRFAIAADVIAERESTASTTPGLGHVGEMLGYASVYDDSSAANIAALRDQTTDFNEGEQQLGPDVPADPLDHTLDGFVGDAEEKLAMFSLLNQLTSTRSDVFTAYVLVRAYPGSDFTDNGDVDADGIFDPTFEYRLIATFDRSSGRWQIGAVTRSEN